ncbi:MAG: leucyl aminopeptidase family protein [Phycisphaerales bacterium]|nr:leucyl aminopeptidase family protein [Phycisphaerales bacterium]
MYRTIRTGSPRKPAVLIGLPAGTSRLPKSLIELDEAHGGRIKLAMRSRMFRGESGDVIVEGEDIVLVGLGEMDSLDLNAIRRLGGRLVRKLHEMDIHALDVEIDLTIPRRIAGPESVGQALAEGMVLANWQVDFFDGKATTNTPSSGSLSLGSACQDVRGGMRRGIILAESTNESRRLSATPPNICIPSWVAQQARAAARKYGFKCRVISFAEAKRLGMGGLVNVGKGSSHKPCMMILEHKPARPRPGHRLALVGKTMTYDSGGYSLKISNSMKGMKYDMNGGAAVFGAMVAVARLKLPVHVFAVLPCAENLVSGDAYRPDDIITMHNGVTVEVTNTDAEGRLILGDALSWTCRRLKPTAIVDVATLTGGVVVGLGHFCAGLWCENTAFRNQVEAAAESTGERVWQLPLWEEHRAFMRSQHADIWNSGPSRNAHPIQGAAFLSYFVDEKIPWAHLDIAGVSAVEKRDDLHVVGPTGYGVRLLSEIVARTGA